MSTQSLAALISTSDTSEMQRPWQRVIVTPELWNTLSQGLGVGDWSLLGLWGEASAAYLALYQAPTTFVVASLVCPERRLPSVGRWHPPAQRLERTLHDLFGLQIMDAPDQRPWLDHGCWVSHPAHATATPAPLLPYRFLPVEGQSLHQIPVGPVHAGIIEPGHFRFTANGETIVRLEERLGYVHKGIEHLLQGADIERAARLVGRVSGDSTVAYALAFARAVEAATATVIPNRAHWLRALMAELERLANHCGDIGAVCNDAAFSLMLAHCAVLREQVLRTNALCFGQRLLMDCVVPGGVAADLTSEGIASLRALLTCFREQFPPLVDLYDNTASLQQRTVHTGFVKPALIQQFACGGFVGRAGGRDFDARYHASYPPYDELEFSVPLRSDSDVNGRVWLRICEVQQSLALIEQILQRLPSGLMRVPLNLPGEVGEGIAMVESFRGDVLVWLRLNADGTVARCHPRDPSWFQWPLLEAAVEGNIVADFPLCNKSFNCSYSGHDL